MTARPRVRGIAAVLVTLVAAGLATYAQNDAQAASPAGSGSGDKAAAVTRLHLHITGCDHCSVQLQQAIHGRAEVWQSSSQRIGDDHRVTFRVPTGRTAGMSFVLRAPWAHGLDWVPNMITRYAGHRIDAFVTRDEARQAGRAAGCWAGTRLNDLTLDFHVARVAAETAAGDPTKAPLAYSTHTMSSWRPFVDTYKGSIANQEAFYCTRPKTTQVTFEAASCEGCEIQVMNGARFDENFWGLPEAAISHGSVTFTVPRPLTRGLSATVRAPWEGAPPFTTEVAFRYAGHRVGDSVTFTDARRQTRGSACWGGSTEAAWAIPLTVRQVTVQGNTGPTAGSIAFARVTQSWLKPMMDAHKGVLGAQEAVICRK
jgi:hypothetical protein